MLRRPTDCFTALTRTPSGIKQLILFFVAANLFLASFSVVLQLSSRYAAFLQSKGVQVLYLYVPLVFAFLCTRMVYQCQLKQRHNDNERFNQTVDKIVLNILESFLPDVATLTKIKPIKCFNEYETCVDMEECVDMPDVDRYWKLWFDALFEKIASVQEFLSDQFLQDIDFTLLKKGEDIFWEESFKLPRKGLEHTATADFVKARCTLVIMFNHLSDHAFHLSKSDNEKPTSREEIKVLIEFYITDSDLLYSTMFF